MDGPAQDGTRGRSAVLLVDDEKELLVTMEAALASEFDVETAAAAGEAELLLGAREFHVIVCDHLLPGESGLDFLLRMRERHPRMERILLTGYLNPELLARSTRVADLSECVLKPAHGEELRQAVRRALARRRAAENGR